uniref:Uncharacterized protein n=1 Tax=Rhizophora mucronata TaxID=61149 RepID=A0A2P2R409_RHIMU
MQNTSASNHEVLTDQSKKRSLRESTVFSNRDKSKKGLKECMIGMMTNLYRKGE